jgi:hypothetical protein
MLFHHLGLASPWGRRPAIATGAAMLVTTAALAATALAATPVATSRFSGTAKEYMNNAPTWTYEGNRESYSFQTSKNRQQMLKFVGAYFYYCGAGTTTVTDKSIAVAAKGSFSNEGHWTERVDGKVTGTTYAKIWGQFTGKGKTANVSYLLDFVYVGHHVNNPYSTTIKSSRNSCESWIHGTAGVSP